MSPRRGKPDTTPPTEPPIDDRATSEVVASLIANLRALITKELELAKLEIQRIVMAKVIALGSAIAGAMMLLFVLAFAGVTGAKALEEVFAPWLAWLIVTGAYTLVTGILLLVAYRFAVRSVKPERTQRDVKRTVEWAKEQVHS
jgi:hypothetical protein